MESKYLNTLASTFHSFKKRLWVIYRIPIFFSAAICISCITLLTGCEYDSRSSSRKENKEYLAAVYLLATKPADSVSSCENSQKKALSCASRASSTVIYISALQTTYSITVRQPQSEKEICSELVNNPRYPNPSNTTVTWSTGAKNCIFDCSARYWDKKESEGKCNQSDYTSILDPSSDSTYKDCQNKCMTQGTVVWY